MTQQNQQTLIIKVWQLGAVVHLSHMFFRFFFFFITTSKVVLAAPDWHQLFHSCYFISCVATSWLVISVISNYAITSITLLSRQSVFIMCTHQSLYTDSFHYNSYSTMCLSSTFLHCNLMVTSSERLSWNREVPLQKAALMTNLCNS